ncbi:MAG: winged helix-turn-helix transcriptional regulator, partial [Burkholderiaceae bacterium]
IGDAWTLRILRELFRGVRRFSDFSAKLGISKDVLAGRLDRMVEQQVVRRSVEPGRHPEYRLTERGLDLWALMLAMWLWESQWDSGPEGALRGIDAPRRGLTHLRCRHAMWPTMCCAECGVEMAAFDWQWIAADAVPADDGGESSGFRRATRALRDQHGQPLAGRLQRVMGDRWNSALVVAAFDGATSFSEFERHVQAPPSLLTQRLRELQQLRILEYQADPGRHGQYRLSRAGAALYPLVLELFRWGAAWLSGADRAGVLVHAVCGRAMHARWHCGHCRAPLSRAELHFEAPPD